MARTGWAAAVVGALMLSGGLVACGGDNSRGDVNLYLDHVRQGPGKIGDVPIRDYVASHRALFVKEGYQACQWIDGRPTPHDEGRERRTYATSTVPILKMHPRAFAVAYRGYYAEVAWRTLCHPVFVPMPED